MKPLERIARYVRPDEHHQAFNFTFLSTEWGASAMRASIAESFATNDAVGAPTTWVLSNHDVIRHATRLALAPEEATTQLGAPVTAPDPEIGVRRARAATTMMLALPGSAYLYQGEELGLPEVLDLPATARQDPTFRRTNGARLGRDGCRVPIPWVSDAHGYGFGPAVVESAVLGDAANGPPGAEPWLPQPASFAALSVDVQQDDPTSTLELYRRLLAARRSLGLGRGSFSFVGAADDVLEFEVRASQAAVRVLVNFGPPAPLPVGARVIIASDPSVGETLPPTVRCGSRRWAQPEPD